MHRVSGMRGDGSAESDVICFSHLRWGFVFQRPNHLMSRAAKSARVFWIEEPVLDGGAGGPWGASASLTCQTGAPGVTVCVPHLPRGTDVPTQEALVRHLLDGLVRDAGLNAPWCWYYSPMMLPIGGHIDAARVVYDCMDELSTFAGAPAELPQRERDLLRRADVVFTGGHSLFEAKRRLHQNVHPFPSSVDAQHFADGKGSADPADQAGIPHPRVGFFGVIDERLDVELLRELAEARPDWHLVMIGPVVKIDPATLPRSPNIHWLGGKSYAELPRYLAGWDVAMLPFALNDATRFISPTKTLEYLAAGKPVVSTAIRDVVSPYGDDGLVRIADAASFPAAVEAALDDPFPAGERAVAGMLARTSWDRTWSAMKELVVSARP
jgi:UDP-galactopyranose mutase